MNRSNRLANGGQIDRAQPLDFTFDGRAFKGYAGDTLASALLASGVRGFGRSFKYHRLRGVLTAGSDEPNALVELRQGARREPNSRATTVELFAGLAAQSQNRWPSLAFDLGAVNSLFSSIFVAGFYYKTFMWPAKFWEKIYEPAIRRAAGLGRASLEADPDHYEKAHAFCDVLVIGSGPAGLCAALAAGRAGSRVILCEEDFALGGRLNGERREIDGIEGSAWVRQMETELASCPELRIMRRTTVFGAYDGNTFGALERVSDHLPTPPTGHPRQRFWKIVAKQIVLASGAIERPIVFGGNDLPGVMMASAVRTYLNRFAVVPGNRTALFTATDDGWKTAFDLRHAGLDVEAVIDARRDIHPSLTSHAQRLNVRVLSGAVGLEAHGGSSIREVKVLDSAGRTTRLAVDLLAMSGGWSPNIALTTHLGTRPRWSQENSAFVPGEGSRGFRVAGSAAGTHSLREILREGGAAGVAAAEAAGFNTPTWRTPRTDDELTDGMALWRPQKSKLKSFVDFQNDVTDEDVLLAAREGFRSVELLKRYTTLGMATDQGKTSNLNGHAILAEVTQRTVPEVGTTVFRPPYTPVAIGALASTHRGKHFRPTRLTSGHAWAASQGAKFVEAGQWLRAQWFTKPGESDWLETVTREAKAVRASVGVCDVSTLGKIDVQGTDAGQFLDNVYANKFSSLPVGKARYGLMLREDGLVMDDGTAARFATDHYVVSTTTVNAAKVMQHLEHARQVLWPELDVQIVSVTEQWAQYAIAGPQSRHLLGRLFGNAIDVSNAAFPHLTCAEFSWNGTYARLFRMSFSGELAYELAVPARYGDATIRAIMMAGKDLNVTPYGTEALSVLRIEKGHVAGNELNGMTTARDLGLGKLMSTQKDFIGRTLAGRPGLMEPDRPTLVGVKPADPTARLHAGAHFLALGAQPSLANDQGYLTSVAYSPVLGHWIGLGFLSRGPARHGERVRAYDPLRGGDTVVEVTSPIFYDSEGSRLRE